VEDDEIFDLIKEKKEPSKKKKNKKEEGEEVVQKKKEYQFPCNSIYFFEDDYDSEDDSEMKIHEKKYFLI
jgi:hypothetical protein